MYKELYLLITTTLLSTKAVTGAKLPPFIKACALRTPDFEKCAVKHGNEALPFIIRGDRLFGIPSFDPLVLPLVQFSTGTLYMNATEVNVKGIPTVSMTGMRVDEERQNVTINTFNPMVSMDFNYSVSGKVASIAIEGTGTGELTLFDTVYDYFFDFDIIEKNKQHFANITKDELQVKPKNIHIQLNNLFNGNKLIGDNLNKFLNENWRDIIVELNPFISEVVGSIIRRMVGNLFKKVPIEEIFPDYVQNGST